MIISKFILFINSITLNKYVVTEIRIFTRLLNTYATCAQAHIIGALALFHNFLV